MRAVVVYESIYGNTHEVAASIADGLRDYGEVTLVPAAEATGDRAGAADLLVAGGPTHMHGMSTAGTRQMAAKSAAKDGSGLELDPDAAGPGIRDWLGRLGAGHGAAAAFDTRFNGVAAFTGRASRAIGKLLKRHGYHLIADPESFLISKENTLLGGEAERARRWGAALGAAVSGTYSPAGR